MLLHVLKYSKTVIGGGIMKGKKILTDFIKSRLLGYIAGTLILIVTSIVSLRIPKILGVIIDDLKKKNMSTDEILKNVFLMLGVVILVFCLKFLWRYLLIGNCRFLECHLRDKLFDHLQTLPVSFYNNNKTGDLVAYAINDIQAVRFTFGFGYIQLLEGVIISSASIIFMARTINPVLTLLALAPVPFAALIMFALGKLIRGNFAKVQKAFASISDKVQENISGIRVIKAFAQENEEVENFIKYNQARVETQMKLTRISALLAPAAQICFGISFMLFIIFGSELVVSKTISLGDYIAFNSYMTVIMGPIMNVSRIIEVWQRGIASFGRLNEIFSVPPGIEDPVLPLDTEEIGGCVEIKNLNFTYPGTEKRALKNINLTLQRGKTLGILGKTGSGKTTLVNLLLRLYNIKDGHIFIDGQDINRIPVDLLRESIGYVPQDNFLFSATIRNNIEFFRHIYSDYEIEEAARLSGVYDNITDLPEGFQTVVGERGVTLSGGQKQRISIARALVKNPSILILDDSLSAVDTKTEQEILENIKGILKNRTGVMISHRVSTIMHSDEIIFMEGGKIVERGNHATLLALKGVYYKLYMSQTDFDNPFYKEVDAI
jgi:ATP-binding cassette, subfamily B, multidrug efflux pump